MAQLNCLRLLIQGVISEVFPGKDDNFDRSKANGAKFFSFFEKETIISNIKFKYKI